MRRLIVFGVMCAATLLAAGCGSGDAGSESTPSSAPASSAAAPSSAAEVPRPNAKQTKHLLAKLRKIEPKLVDGRKDPMIDDAVNICEYVMRGESKDVQVHAVVVREDGITEDQAADVLAAIKSTFCK